MQQYLDIVDNILSYGKKVGKDQERTGTGTIALPETTFKFDMSDGSFPFLTTKKMHPRLPFTEMEGFIKGVTNKRWFQERDVFIWDEWCTSLALKQYNFSSEKGVEKAFNKVIKKYNTDYGNLKTPKKLKNIIDDVKTHFIAKPNGKYELNGGDYSELLSAQGQGSGKHQGKIEKFAQYIEEDLGPIYGFQWRNFGAGYNAAHYNIPLIGRFFKKGCDVDYSKKGKDQLVESINKLKNKPGDRRNIVTAWNPTQFDIMGLPPCHKDFQVNVLDGKIHLNWQQRSVDVPLGLPFNIAQYGLLLKLFAEETGYDPGTLTGHLGNTHIYLNQIDDIKKQLQREPKESPSVEFKDFTSILEWSYNPETTVVKNYDPHPGIKFPPPAV
ncbi:MAG: thymidylate synthase [Nanobdellota archaeon]